MLEALVSSKIRRTLFEYLLGHPSDRFYLRGLAKELGLSVSPLRRELKRLEQRGMLRADQEGNILFYTIATDSPEFHQLQQASQQIEPPAPVALAPAPQPVPVAVEPPSSSWARPLSARALLGFAGAGMALMMMVVSLAYVSLFRTDGASRQHARTLAVDRGRPTASGVMEGQRWQLVPGGFGGFSQGTSAGSR